MNICAQILLRELDTPERAANFAERTSRAFELCQNNPAAAAEYAQAAEQLRALIPA